MRINRLQFVAVAFTMFLVSTHANVSQARIINSINFLGAHAEFDAEAEYRLLQLGIAIVETRQVGAQVSLNVKDAYGASILGNVQAHSTALNQARDHGNALRGKWENVNKISADTAKWLDGKLRPEYADAFCRVVKEGKTFQNSLVEVGASAEYMNWAFEIILSSCQEKRTKSVAVLSTFSELSKLARLNADNVSKFFQTLNEVSQSDASFMDRGTYGYIFEHLAIRGEKPVLFELDEIYFTGVSRFNIFYEALEQVAREAHTRIPGSHDQVFQTFDLQFTE